MGQGGPLTGQTLSLAEHIAWVEGLTSCRFISLRAVAACLLRTRQWVGQSVASWYQYMSVGGMERSKERAPYWFSQWQIEHAANHWDLLPPTGTGTIFCTTCLTFQFTRRFHVLIVLFVLMAAHKPGNKLYCQLRLTLYHTHIYTYTVNRFEATLFLEPNLLLHKKK